MLRKEDTNSAMEMEKGEASGLKKRGVSIKVALKKTDLQLVVWISPADESKMTEKQGHRLVDLAGWQSVYLAHPQDLCSAEGCGLESSHKLVQHFTSVLLSVPGPSLPNSGVFRVPLCFPASYYPAER